VNSESTLDPSQPTASLDLVGVLWRRRGLLVLGMLLGLALGSWYYLSKPPTYSSSALLSVMKRRLDPLPTAGADGRFAVVDDVVATQEVLIKSQAVLRVVANILKGEIGRMELPPELPANIDSQTILMNYIAGGLAVSRIKEGVTGANSNVLTISFKCGSPKDCQVVVDTVIKGYQDYLQSEIGIVDQDTANSVRRSKEDVEKKLKQLEDDYEVIQSQIRVSSPLAVNDLKARINVNETKKADLRLNEIDLQTREELIKKGIKEGQNRPALMAMFEMSLPGKKDRAPGSGLDLRSPDDALVNLKIQEEEMLQTLGEEHPQVVAMRKRINLLREYFKKLETQKPEPGDEKRDSLDLYVQVLKQQLEGNKLQQKYIDGILEADRASVRKLDDLLVQETLQRERCERQRKMLANLTDREQQIEMNTLSQPFVANPISRPGIGGKIAPMLMQSLLLGAFVGLILGGGLSYLAEVTDQSFRSPEEIRERLGVGILGQIPPLVDVPDSEKVLAALDSKLVTLHQPRSIQAEAYRGLRTSLYFSTRGKGHQVIQITSPNQGDGKSTLAANLAISIAQSGKKVVLVDADFRRPRVHKIFGFESDDLGLASIMVGELALHEAIQHSAVPNLSLLPCGPRPTNPAELLTSTRFSEVLDELRKEFDFVLVDTPPMLAVSDPAVVATRVDGVLIALRLGKHARPAASRACEMLNTMGANLLGIIVNHVVSPSRGRLYQSSYAYEYGYKYGYDYQYTYQEDDDAEPKAITVSAQSSAE
jgi:polysaccharide biosynthesis transport protein